MTCAQMAIIAAFGLLILCAITCGGTAVLQDTLFRPTLVPIAVLPEATYDPSPTRSLPPTAGLGLADTPGPSDTPAPSNTPAPTSVSIPATATAAAKATDVAFLCLRASYVADVTVPDGTRFDKNASFTKTWRVKNNGKCDWGMNTMLAFESGDKMDAPEAVAVGDVVKVGQQIEISVPMIAPAQNGRYKGVWRVKDVVTGRFFGGQLTVVIVVGEPTPVPTRRPTPIPWPTVPPVAWPTSPPSRSGGCCKHCGPNSQPCGDSCISLRYTCHKGPGCACW